MGEAKSGALRLAIGAGAAFAAVMWTAPAGAADRCPPEGYTRAALLELKSRGFSFDQAEPRERLALALVACLADPDPVLRDGIGFEALSSWMRANALSLETRRAIYRALLPRLAPGAADRAGFRQPFAALALSELARTDRLAPWLEPAERDALLQAGAGYLERVRDYRGFDQREGWRHGVAHGADLMLQLALNPALERSQLDRVLAAVAAQVVPAGGHFYVYGEGARLARPVLAVAQRNLHDADYWRAWFARIAAPGELGDWSKAFESQAGLARRHDTLAFLQALYVGANESGGELRERLLPAVTEALKSIP